MSNALHRTHINSRLYSGYVRTFAALGVILIHSTGTYLHEFSPAHPDDSRWWTGNIYCSLLRWATPFFILLSGSVFLSPARTETPAQFLQKRFRRVLLPFAFWSFFYLLYQYRGSFNGGTLPPFGDVLHKVFFEDVYYHLWFIPMILGLYLLTPTFRIFIRHAGKGDIEYFLGLCFSITAIQHLLPGFFVVEYIGWLGYIGFYVLGYYLSTYPLQSLWKKILIGLGLLMPAVTAIGTRILSQNSGAYDEKLLVYFSPNVVIMTAAFFIWIREHDWVPLATRHPRFNALVQEFALLSFGVYFLHVMVLDVLKNGYIAGWHTTSDVFFNQPVHPMIGALLQAGTVAILTAFCIFLLSRIKGMSRWIM